MVRPHVSEMLSSEQIEEIYDLLRERDFLAARLKALTYKNIGERFGLHYQTVWRMNVGINTRTKYRLDPSVCPTCRQKVENPPPLGTPLSGLLYGHG